MEELVITSRGEKKSIGLRSTSTAGDWEDPPRGSVSEFVGQEKI